MENRHKFPIVTDWKIGFTTRQIEELGPDEFVIHDFCSGWKCADVNKDTLDKVKSGELSLLSLQWY